MSDDSRGRVVATIEARMGSSRLPGKVLMSALGDPMLWHLVRRLRAVPSIDNVVIATTISAADDAIVDFANAVGVDCFRGSENDVMDRVIRAGESDHADVLVEITGDCPVIDPDLVEQTIRMFLQHDVDYASNAVVRSYPDGMDTQVMTMAALKSAAARTKDQLDREHVSRYIWKHPDQYRLMHLVAPPSLHWPELGLTLDEQGDYLLLKKLIEELAPSDPLFSCLDMIRMLKVHPEWLAMNQDVIRKGDA